MKLKFWGVRGSVPVPGPRTVKYGGNTACLELQIEERSLVIDAGSGIREFGNAFMARVSSASAPPRLELFLTHTHMDHLLGFPFFTPIYIPGTDLTVYGPVTHEENYLEDMLNGQFSYRYFPVRWTELAARIDVVHLKEETRDLGDGLVLTTKYLNHPVLTLGYRFACRGKSICTVFDTEPFQNPFITDLSHPSYDREMALAGEETARLENERLEAFFAGADIAVFDGQYTEKEYVASHQGWGHSACEQAIAAAQRNGVSRLVLFHHDPQRTDEELDALAAGFDRTGDTEVIIAREGTEMTV